MSRDVENYKLGQELRAIWDEIFEDIRAIEQTKVELLSKAKRIREIVGKLEGEKPGDPTE